MSPAPGRIALCVSLLLNGGLSLMDAQQAGLSLMKSKI
jgi:hypothetical protein